MLPELIAALTAEDRRRADRLLAVGRSHGVMFPPDSMRSWIAERFGSPNAVDDQIVVRTTNLVTFEGTQFNPLRAQRPAEPTPATWQDTLVGGDDPFCHPLELTPADPFGRVHGVYALTASNLAKYEALHAVIIFARHDARHFTRESIGDMVEVAMRWGNRAVEIDSAAKYLFLHWNCLWKAGASIIHGHAQVAATRGMHFPKIENLRRQSLAYQAETGRNYFDDLTNLHRSLGLTIEQGPTTILASLTPIKEREVLVISPTLNASLVDAVSHVLSTYTQRLGVESFNAAFYFPPSRPTPEDWSHVPYIVRLVDRGKLASRTTDMGAMELYAASVVSSDPFLLADELRQVD